VINLLTLLFIIKIYQNHCATAFLCRCRIWLFRI